MEIEKFNSGWKALLQTYNGDENKLVNLLNTALYYHFVAVTIENKENYLNEALKDTKQALGTQEKGFGK